MWDLVGELSLKVVNNGLAHFPVVGQPLWIDLINIDGDDRVIATGADMPIFHSLHEKIEVKLEKFLPSHTVQQFSFKNFKGITCEQLNDFLNE